MRGGPWGLSGASCMRLWTGGGSRGRNLRLKMGQKMIYPVLCYLPGFFILAVSVLAYPQPGVQAFMAIGCVAAYALQSWRLMGVCVFTGLIAGLVLGAPHGLVFVPVMALGWALMSVMLAARCPRCRYNIAPGRRFWQKLPHSHWCPMCGRSRQRVWPGQYLKNPEAWDGEYHDEGGGVSELDALITWRRYILYKRYLKRQTSVAAGSGVEG